MGSAILAHGDAGMGGGNLDVEVGVGAGHTDLVVHAARDEARESTGKGNLATQRQTCGNANHVGLRNAGLDESFRKFFDEIAHLQTANHIGTKGKDIGIFAAGFH